MQIVTQQELCKLLQISVPIIIEWQKSGMPCLRPPDGGRTVRYVLEDVVAWMKRNAERALENKGGANEA
jgi:phage terminase Nu1 subunit (DNA packaging protein)